MRWSAMTDQRTESILRAEQYVYVSAPGVPPIYMGRKPVGGEFIPWDGTSFIRVDEGPWRPWHPRR